MNTANKREMMKLELFEVMDDDMQPASKIEVTFNKDWQEIVELADVEISDAVRQFFNQIQEIINNIEVEEE